MADEVVTTNPEGEVTEEEVVETEEETLEDELEEDDLEEEQTDEEKEQLRIENEELKNKNKSLYEKLKSGYKKHAKTKETTLPKEEVKKIMEEIIKEETAEKKFLESNEDAKDLLPEIKKLQKEKWLDIDTAYDVVRGKMLRDEWYKNQILGERAANYGKMEKKEPWFKYAHLFTTPVVSRPREQD
jgi:hypothetical protein